MHVHVQREADGGVHGKSLCEDEMLSQEVVRRTCWEGWEGISLWGLPGCAASGRGLLSLSFSSTIHRQVTKYAVFEGLIQPTLTKRLPQPQAPCPCLINN